MQETAVGDRSTSQYGGGTGFWHKEDADQAHIRFTWRAWDFKYLLSPIRPRMHRYTSHHSKAQGQAGQAAIHLAKFTGVNLCDWQAQLL